ADARFHEPIERAFVFIGSAFAQWLLRVAHVSSHEVIENGGHGCRGRGGRSIVNWVFAPINALAQLSSLLNGLEYGPVSACSDCEAMFATTQAVIQHEGSCTCRSDADSKPPRCLRALDYGACKIGDAVARGGDRQSFDGFLTKSCVCHGSWCPRCVRTINLLDCRSMYAEYQVVSTEILS